MPLIARHTRLRQVQSPRTIAGGGLVECMIAMAVLAVFFIGAFGVNSQVLGLVRASREAAAAEQCTRDRIDKMRNASWTSMVSADYICNTVLASTGNTFPDLAGLVVTITVSAYPPPSGTTGASTIIVTRSADGSASVNAGGDGNMVNEKTVVVQVTASWPTSKRTRTKEAYTLVSTGGISGRNK